MKRQRIRILALCIFSHAGSILVFEGYDSKKKRHFYRPLGGAVEFGEPVDAALHREIREELGEEITHLTQMGVLENLFTYEGERGHEIVFIYNARFKDPQVYSRKDLKASEDDGTPFKLRWLKIGQLGQLDHPLFPEGLSGLIQDQRSDHH